jgi:hypothetical protein
MMRTLRDCVEITSSDLVEQAAGLRADGWRLITASAVPRGGGAYTVLYHFERENRLRHLRMELDPGEGVPSIGAVYPGAALVENEMVELQGVSVSDMAVDYGGRLYRDFARVEGWAHDAAGAEPVDGPLQAAAALRLDACVPVDDDGREIRAPQSRVPPEPRTRPGTGDAPDAEAAPDADAAPGGGLAGRAPGGG